MTGKNFLAGIGSLSLLLGAPSLASEVFEVGLIPCNDTLCGETASTALREGEVEVDRSGGVEVEIERGPANTEFCVVFEPIGGEAVSVGSFSTDGEGDADAHVGSLDARGAMGLFVLRREDCDSGERLLVTGFSTEVGAHDEDRDHDGVHDDDDGDDDNDGIPDDEDAHPYDANAFDDIDDKSDLRAEYRAERRELREDYRDERRELQETFRERQRELKDDMEDRLDDF